MANLTRYSFGEQEDDNGYLKPSITQSDSGAWVKFEDVVELLKTPTNTCMAAMHSTIADMSAQIAALRSQYESLQRIVQAMNTINVSRV